MTDYDLTVVPVTDDEERVVGVITVDDVLELVLPAVLAPPLRPPRRGFN